MKKLFLILIGIVLSIHLFSQVCFSSGKKITLESPVSTRVIAFDVDNDGDKDIVSDDVNLYWYENDGSMSFNIQSQISYTSSIEYITFSKNNTSDNYFDLLIMDSGPNSHLHSLINDGSGNFTEEGTSVLAQGTNFATGDTNGDGDTDIITINREQPGSCSWDGYETWNFSSSGELQNNIFTCTENLIDFIYLYDINNDGFDDLLYPFGYSPGVILKLRDGENFEDADTIISESDINGQLNFGDIDDDGKIDIISKYQTKIVWYKNEGSNIFSSQKLIFDFGDTNNSYKGGFPIDIDGDGDIDIVTNTQNNIIYFENLDGNGTFGSENIICNANTIRDIFLVDIDDDLDTDILVAGNGGTYLFENSPEISILTQPENITADNGTEISFSVEVFGSDTTFQWYFNNSIILNGGNISGATSSILTINNISESNEGNYKCHIMGACEDEYSNEVILNVNTIKVSEINNSSFRLFINSLNNTITINFKNSMNNTNIIITSLDGRILFNKNINNSKHKEIDMSQFTKGIYFVTVKQNQQIFTETIIIK